MDKKDIDIIGHGIPSILRIIHANEFYGTDEYLLVYGFYDYNGRVRDKLKMAWRRNRKTST